MAKFFIAASFIFAMLTLAPANAAPAHQHELNIINFAACLDQQTQPFSLSKIRNDQGFNDFDLLLIYLAVYPGVRINGLTDGVQDFALSRWEYPWAIREAKLANDLLELSKASQTIAPAQVFSLALRECGGAQNIFCAALILHNTLRTLGRHEKAIGIHPLTGARIDYNPNWFKENKSFWQTNIPRIQSKLISFRKDGGGDRFGEWYHFFGILTYSIHELALKQNLTSVDLAVRLNQLLNPILAGEPEALQKAEIDRESVAISWLLMKKKALSKNAVTAADLNCADPATYVTSTTSIAPMTSTTSMP